MEVETGLLSFRSSPAPQRRGNLVVRRAEGLSPRRAEGFGDPIRKPRTTGLALQAFTPGCPHRQRLGGDTHGALAVVLHAPQAEWKARDSISAQAQTEEQPPELF